MLPSAGLSAQASGLPLLDFLKHCLCADQDLGSQEGYRGGPGELCPGEDRTHTVIL